MVEPAAAATDGLGQGPGDSVARLSGSYHWRERTWAHLRLRRLRAAPYGSYRPVGARNSAHAARPRDTRRVGHRAGRVDGRVASIAVAGESFSRWRDSGSCGCSVGPGQTSSAPPGYPAPSGPGATLERWSWSESGADISPRLSSTAPNRPEEARLTGQNSCLPW
jgi:hypothetical protein